MAARLRQAHVERRAGKRSPPTRSDAISLARLAQRKQEEARKAVRKAQRATVRDFHRERRQSLSGPLSKFLFNSVLRAFRDLVQPDAYVATEEQLRVFRSGQAPMHAMSLFRIQLGRAGQQERQLVMEGVAEPAHAEYYADASVDAPLSMNHVRMRLATYIVSENAPPQIVDLAEMQHLAECIKVLAESAPLSTDHLRNSMERAYPLDGEIELPAMMWHVMREFIITQLAQYVAALSRHLNATMLPADQFCAPQMLHQLITLVLLRMWENE